MNESLCPVAGNALEVRLAIDYLTGVTRPARLHEVTMALCAEMLVLSGTRMTHGEARAKLQAALDSGGGGGTLRAHGRGAGRPGRPSGTPGCAFGQSAGRGAGAGA